MSEKDKAIAKKMTDAIKALPEEKKEFILGFAEGIAAMSQKKEEGAENEAG